MDGIITQCEHCSTRFEAPGRSAGGLANCASCGLATEVPGGKDPEWAAICALGAVAAGVVIAVTYQQGGLFAAIAATAVCSCIGLVVRLSS